MPGPSTRTLSKRNRVVRSEPTPEERRLAAIHTHMQKAEDADFESMVVALAEAVNSNKRFALHMEDSKDHGCRVPVLCDLQTGDAFTLRISGPHIGPGSGGPTSRLLAKFANPGTQRAVMDQRRKDAEEAVDKLP